MEKSEYRNIYVNEETHGWYQGMKQLSLSLLDKYLPKKNGLQILDAGCGTGMMMQTLTKYGSTCGIDISSDAINFCRKRGLVNAQKGNIITLPFNSDSFDLITCFDVIYHKQAKPDLAIKEFNRVLKKGGILLLRVPALEILRGSHDQIVHTSRRFTSEEIRKLLIKSGFAVGKISYINFFLFPVVLISRLLSRRQKDRNSSDVIKMNWIVNSLIWFSLKLEAILLNYTTFPIGVSIVAVATKK